VVGSLNFDADANVTIIANGVEFTQELNIPGGIVVAPAVFGDDPTLWINASLVLNRCLTSESGGVTYIAANLTCNSGFLDFVAGNGSRPSLVFLNPISWNSITITVPSLIVNQSVFTLVYGEATIILPQDNVTNGTFQNYGGQLQISEFTFLSIQGGYVQDQSAVIQTELVVGSNVSAINISGLAVLNGTLQFDVNPQPTVTTKLLALTVGSREGTFIGEASKRPGASTEIATLSFDYSDSRHIYLVYTPATPSNPTWWYLLWWVWVLIGVGIILLIVGLVFLIRRVRRGRYHPLD